MKPAEKQDLQNFKFIIVGDSGVGKSCLLIRYSKNEFAVDYNATIGVEFQSKIVKINDMSVKLQIWDTAGQESFRSIVKSFYKKSLGVLIVYSVANSDSFASVKHWLKEARENAEDSAIFALIGAQSDRESERKVTRDEGEKLQQEEKFDLFFEVSSKENINIDHAFDEIAKAAFLKRINSSLKKSFQNSSFLSSNENTRSQSLPPRNPSVQQPIIIGNGTQQKKKGSCC